MPYFFVTCNAVFERILFDDLLFIEAANNYIILQTRQKKLITYLIFKDVIDQLPQDRFIKVHKSYVVALDKIENLNGEEMKVSEFKLPISRALKEEVMEKVVNRNLLKR